VLVRVPWNGNVCTGAMTEESGRTSGASFVHPKQVANDELKSHCWVIIRGKLSIIVTLESEGEYLYG
jgi:hypothetical protein